MIDGLARGIRKEMTKSVEEDFKVVATGGMARLIAPYATCIDIIDPQLTLRGLQLIYNKARQAAITQELSEIVSGAAAIS